MQVVSIENSNSKEEKYKQLVPQIKSLIEEENNGVANICNTISALHHAMNFLWTGLYFVSDNQLQLGMFQGTAACTRIQFSKGVCGACASQKEIIIVDDVDRFDGHIACSSLSKSEIVLPIFDKTKNVIAVFDVDSENLCNFDEIDARYLKEVLEIIQSHIVQFAKTNF